MQDFFNDLKSHFEHVLDNSKIEFFESLGEYSLTVAADNLIEVMGHLKHSVKFLQLTDITAVDYPKRSPRFDVVYHVLNMHRNVRLRVKISTNEFSVPSLCRVYKAANWYEREIFDMFGIVFDQHPNLERILTDYNFDAHPLRKDFPTEGYFELHYNEISHAIAYEPLNLPQSRRQFDFIVNKWNTPRYEVDQKERGEK